MLLHGFDSELASRRLFGHIQGGTLPLVLTFKGAVCKLEEMSERQLDSEKCSILYL